MTDEREQVTVFAPATVANLGPGYDVLGLALEGVGDRVEVDLAMGGRTIPAVYETTLHEPPSRVVLETRGS